MVLNEAFIFIKHTIAEQTVVRQSVLHFTKKIEEIYTFGRIISVINYTPIRN